MERTGSGKECGCGTAGDLATGIMSFKICFVLNEGQMLATRLCTFLPHFVAPFLSFSLRTLCRYTGVLTPPPPPFVFISVVFHRNRRRSLSPHPHRMSLFSRSQPDRCPRTLYAGAQTHMDTSHARTHARAHTHAHTLTQEKHLSISFCIMANTV